MTFHCKLCNYTTDVKGNYNKHIETIKHKKNIIIDIELKNKNNEKFICNICNKQLSSKQSLILHSNICKGVKSTLECSICNKIFNNRNTRYVHEKKCSIRKKILQTDINTTKNIITNNINNGIINNIVINNYGNENIDYFIENPNFIKFMNKCVENKLQGICDLIAKKHFDPEHIENHNIRKLNKKDNFLEIYDNNKWNIKDYKDSFDLITIPLEATFYTFMEKVIENDKNIRINIFQNFMKEVGIILGWDLSIDKYKLSFNDFNINEKNKQIEKRKIYKIFRECIYNYSKIFYKLCNQNKL